MLKLTTTLLTTLLLNAHAVTPSFYIPGLKNNRDYKTVQCPTIADEFKPLITNLTRLKTKIKSEANCKPIFEQISRYGDQFQQSRERYLALTTKKKGQVLTASDTKFIKSHAENASQYAFAVLDLVSGGGSCFERDRNNEGLLLASTLIHEVTNLAGNVAGPYGAPIAIVGNLIGSFFNGLHTIRENRSGYKFHKLESRQQFIENLCTYYSMQEELNNLLYPRERRENLESIAVAVNEHLADVADGCDGCNRLLTFLDQEEYVSTFGTEKNHSNLINQIYQLEEQANNDSESFAGSYIIDTFNNKKWLEEEIEDFDRNSEEIISNIGQDILMEQKLDIEQYLLERETPRFLKFQLDKARDSYRDAERYYTNTLTYLINAFDYEANILEDPNYNPPYGVAFAYYQDIQKGIQRLEELINNRKLPYDNVVMLESHYNKFINLYDSSYIAYGVFNSYCNFFREAKIFNYSISNVCNSSRGTQLREDLIKITPSARPYNFQNNDGDKGRNTFATWGESLQDTIELLKSTEIN